MGLSTITPETRSEEFIDRIARALGSGGTSPLDTIVPETRHEEFIDRIARANGWTDVSPMASIYPETRMEEFLNRIADNAGGGAESEGGFFQPDTDTDTIKIDFAEEHSDPPTFFIISDIEETGVDTTNTIVMNVFIDVLNVIGMQYPASSTTTYGSIIYVLYRGTGSTCSPSFVTPQYDSDVEPADPGDLSVSYSRWWANTSYIHGYGTNATRLWRAARHYKWLAVWL